MKLHEALNAIRNADPEKTASVAKPEITKQASAPAVTTAPSTLKTALEAAVVAGNATKVASATPASDLEKIAAQVEATESEALLKEAQAYGAAVADGFVARLTQYNDSTSKTASYQPQVFDNEKLASAAFEKGFEDATQTIYKVASDCFTLGFSATDELIRASK